jgi:hypothetical protein
LGVSKSERGYRVSESLLDLDELINQLKVFCYMSELGEVGVEGNGRPEASRLDA